jgi:glycosyltransferase involved in cell wall biosynthesis
MRPKRIGICTTQVPFTAGGAEAHMKGLEKALVEHGYEAEIISIPFKWYPAAQIVQNMLMWRLIDLTEANGKSIDMVIGLKFPAYLAKHPNKVLWIEHQHRTAYELWGTDHCDLIHFEEGARARDIIIHADTKFIPEARYIYTISKTVTDRLRRFNNIESEPLYHPPPNAETLFCRTYGDYIFYPSRLEGLKRQDLLVEAMAYVKTDVQCYLAGTGQLEHRLRELIAERKLAAKVKLLGFVPEAELVNYYADALAVFFGPVDEDYGYVTLEAFYSKKPVITLDDSGGPLEFVKHGVTGFVAPPEPRAIAEAIDLLVQDKFLAQKMGTQGFESIRHDKMSWGNVVRKLVR